MTLRFYFDECTDEDVAQNLVSQGIDVVTVSGLQRKGLKDEDQFHLALQDARVIYSTDRDFLRIAVRYLQQGVPFSGLVYHAQDTRTKRQIIDALVLLNGVLDPPDMINQIEYI